MKLICEPRDLLLSAELGLRLDFEENFVRTPDRWDRRCGACSSPTMSSRSSESRLCENLPSGIAGKGRGEKSGWGIGIEVLLSVPVKTPLPHSHSLDRASLRKLRGPPDVKLPIVFLLLPRLALFVDVEYEFDLSDSEAIVERRELHCCG